METTILVKSSSRPEPYSVVVTKDESGITVLCDCPAGEWGKLCKHKLAVVSGDAGIMFDSEQAGEFQKVTDWLKSTVYGELIDELVKAENRLESAKKRVKGLKDRIAHGMKEGLR